MSTQFAQDQHLNLERQDNENKIITEVEKQNHETTPRNKEATIENTSNLKEKHQEQDENKQAPDQSGGSTNQKAEEKEIAPEKHENEENNDKNEEGNNTNIETNEKVEKIEQNPAVEQEQENEQMNNENKILENEKVDNERSKSQPKEDPENKNTEKPKTPKEEKENNLNEIKENKEENITKDSIQVTEKQEINSGTNSIEKEQKQEKDEKDNKVIENKEDKEKELPKNEEREQKIEISNLINESDKFEEKEENSDQLPIMEKKESEPVKTNQENNNNTDKSLEKKNSDAQEIKEKETGKQEVKSEQKEDVSKSQVEDKQEKKEETKSNQREQKTQKENSAPEKEISKSLVQEPLVKKNSSSSEKSQKKEEKKPEPIGSKSRKSSDAPSDKSNKSGKEAKNGSVKIEKKNSGSQNDIDSKKKVEKKNSGSQNDIDKKKGNLTPQQRLEKEKSPIERKKTDEHSNKSRKGSEKSDTEKNQHKEEATNEKTDVPVNNRKPSEEETPQQDIGESINSIFKFFAVTAKNIEETSKPVAKKAEQLVLNSHILKNIGNLKPLNSFITNNITNNNTPKNVVKIEKKKTTEIPKSPRTEKILLEKTAITPQLKPAKMIKVEDDQGYIHSLKASPISIAKSKDARSSKSKPRQENKAKNEIEEQIRQHKIQEITKLKKTLESKLAALNDQLVELQHTDNSSVSPARSKSIKKETREEVLERQRKALEFAKKMKNEQKNLELLKEKRREQRQVQVMKDIEVLQNQQVHNAGVLKGASQSAKEKYDGKKIYSKAAATGFSTLEERKQQLRSKREFDRAADQNSADEKDHSEKSRKGPKKVVYKSPMLPNVLAWDEEQKRVEAEKIARRKVLKEKQMEYGREIKQSYLPKLQSKYDVYAKKGVYRSQDIEGYLAKAGKEHYYGYMDKFNRRADDQSTKGSVKSYGKADNYNNIDSHPNVKYGKELVHELQDNWNSDHGSKSPYVNEHEHGRNHNVRRSQPIHQGGNEYHVDEPGRNSYPNKSNKKAINRPKELEHDEEVDKLNQELMEEQLMLKDKISGMLSDIKQMETQVKRKEEKLLKEIERKSHEKHSP